MTVTGGIDIELETSIVTVQDFTRKGLQDPVDLGPVRTALLDASDRGVGPAGRTEGGPNLDLTRTSWVSLGDREPAQGEDNLAGNEITFEFIDDGSDSSGSEGDEVVVVETPEDLPPVAAASESGPSGESGDGSGDTAKSVGLAAAAVVGAAALVGRSWIGNKLRALGLLGGLAAAGSGDEETDGESGDEPKA